MPLTGKFVVLTDPVGIVQFILNVLDIPNFEA